ncbi:unnamed protein product [Triticum turgidum subsp. durum]|uniref:Cell cycle checkpoint protein RAD17 n=2 Tax=Triticum TaxID=4564 RepID=A0A9R0S4Q1_TRITD|nr:unnamed protein product [Triticum turgidum subsp. durum]
MGKRPPLVVLSSSSDDDGGGGRCTASRGPSTRKTRTPATAPPAKQAPSSSRKKPRRGSSGGRGRRRASETALSGSLKDEFDMLTEDFSECLNDLGVSGSMRQTDELWIDKYKPLSSGELAVHKKKVEDVKNWLEEKLKAPKGTFGGRSLVLTGQAGVGKSATVKAIAAEIGADLCEWTTPVPTLWAELVHANSELEYVSKLEEFENFVNKIRKYSLLSPTSIGSPKKLIIILIDDIPVTSGKASFARLGKCLTGLIQSTQIPTVISLTHHYKNEANDTATWNSEELESLLQGAGAHKDCYGLGSVIHSPCGRDETLTLFHALGKFLHNKRETHGDVNIDLDSFSLKEQLRRNPLKMDVPEMILSQAHGKVRTVADFLHENVVDFIDDDAVDDAWVVMSYLSEADCLLAGSPIASAHWTVNESNESENMSQLIAASVAARGVLFGNAHPSPSRWHTIRSPKVWQIERTFRSTKGLILKERFDPSSTSGSRNFSDVVTDFRPFERWISPHNDMARNNPSCHDVAGGPNSIDMLGAEGSNCEEDEDEIEEW